MEEKIISLIKKYGVIATLFVIFVGIILFIFNYINIDLLLLKTITTGGDTASHYYPAQYLRDYLLANGKIIGWSPGWYGGFPMFQFYFPLPFVMMVILSYIIPLQIAFKFITILGVLTLPFCAYLLFRWLDFPKEVSGIAAIFTLPFLFMQANSMWGGNILSTFAGEFTYSIGISLSLLYLGLLYKGIKSNKYLIINSLLLASIGLSHVYTLLWVVVTSIFLLIVKDFKSRLIYWFKVNAIAFLLLGFWLIPLIFYLDYTTAYASVWQIQGCMIINDKPFYPFCLEAFPKIFWPFYILTLFGLIYSIIKKDLRIFYLLFSLVISFIGYKFSVNLGIVDIRFIPFIQLLLLLIAVYSFTLIGKLKTAPLISIIVLFLTLYWISDNVTYIPQWAEWNYKGFEGKQLWPQFSGVNNFLKGTENDPRVVYEHSPDHNAAGTIRAFESLPLFSGRSTLEGLYMQSSPSSPFVFYIQSEISQVGSCPFPHRRCTSFNIEKGTEHLKLFNVKHFIARSDQVKNALANNTEYKLVYENNPYQVYELTSNENKYVTIPKYKPLFFPRKNWQERSYELFQTDSDLTVIFDKDTENEPDLIKDPIDQRCVISEKIENEVISFNTNCIGLPHLIKISYFPEWKVEGADKVYLASPSFMLVYPKQEDVRLYFGSSVLKKISIILTLIGIILVISYKKWKHMIII